MLSFHVLIFSGIVSRIISAAEAGTRQPTAPREVLR